MKYLLCSCGGLKMNSDSFQIIDGVVTNTDINLTYLPFNAPCGGQYFDRNVFRIDGFCIVSNLAKPSYDGFSANCSLLFDDQNFELDADGAIDYHTQYLTFVVNPSDATIKLTPYNNRTSPIKPNKDGTYTVKNSRKYDYNITKEGYYSDTNREWIVDEDFYTFTIHLSEE